MTQFHARITGRDQQAMADLVRKYKVLVARHTVAKVAEGYCVDAHASDEQIRAMTADGYSVEKREDALAEGKARQAEIRPNAAAAPRAEFTVAKVASYLSVDDVEAALAAAVKAPFDEFTALIKLPNATWEKR